MYANLKRHNVSSYLSVFCVRHYVLCRAMTNISCRSHQQKVQFARTPVYHRRNLPER